MTDKNGYDFQIVTPKNENLLESVDQDVFDHAVDQRLLREFLSSPGNILVVAVFNARVVGMATGIAYVHPDKPKSLFINEVGVSSAHRRKGVGKKLLSAMVEWGKRNCCHEAWVATEVNNLAARSLYQATGGIEDEEHAVVYVYPLANNQGTEFDGDTH